MSEEEAKTEGTPSPGDRDWERIERFKGFLEALQPAQEHFQESGRQFLLGISTTMTAVGDLLDASSEIAAAKHLASGMILAKSLVDLWIARLPTLVDDRDEVLGARLDALCNLRAVLYAEKERRRDAPEGLNRAAEDTLDTIIKGISEEIDRVVAEQDNRPDEEDATRFEVTIGGDHE